MGSNQIPTQTQQTTPSTQAHQITEIPRFSGISGFPRFPRFPRFSTTLGSVSLCAILLHLYPPLAADLWKYCGNSRFASLSPTARTRPSGADLSSGRSRKSHACRRVVARTLAQAPIQRGELSHLSGFHITSDIKIPCLSLYST